MPLEGKKKNFLYAAIAIILIMTFLIGSTGFVLGIVIAAIGYIFVMKGSGSSGAGEIQDDRFWENTGPVYAEQDNSPQETVEMESDEREDD
ncbi:hypothetical protein J2T58_000192 [Methanocalculus alkaliphilus]|uniref:hypothetical protein n=1 Tax=Methanocalculus alkaliphilus TaxID=768730 RepID=UPI00209C920C|nr:hypothetical protein [Methanocalculus alkaliphilus]MCP1714365.1 hypothetical protein [Methanocalculus alkaliphilus]